ncbi:MAG TPA: class I SAM-dependent RNA methyltransferase [Blastocatellia bacterium]
MPAQTQTTGSIGVGAVIQVRTERLAYLGGAVAHHEGLAIFVPFAAPDELLEVRITEHKKRFARAVIQKILVPSAVRRQPPCRYFGDCGGCQLQHITYPAQLSAKAAFVRDSLERIGRIDWPHGIEVKSADEFGYRLKAQVKVARHHSEFSRARSQTRTAAGAVVSGALTDPAAEIDRDDNRSLDVGFNREASHSVCDIVSCPILVPELDSALTLLRSAVASGTAIFNPDHQDEFELAAGNSEVACAPGLPGLSTGPVERIAGGLRYLFGPDTFFQSNSFLLDDLVNATVENECGGLAIDLYAGVGLFSARLASEFERVLAVESEPRAVALGRKNMANNAVRNVEYYTRPVESWIKEHLIRCGPDRKGSTDLVVLDPPRAGAASIIDDLLAMGPRRITYVSCDPVTLSRDLARLVPAYRIKQIVAFDLFPQTYHVETVTKLELG